MNDSIDRLLREDASQAIADEGFAFRVMGALPARRARRTPQWLKPALVLGSAVVGSSLALLLSPQGGALLQGFEDLAQLKRLTGPAITAIAVSGALLVSALVLAAEAD